MGFELKAMANDPSAFDRQMRLKRGRDAAFGTTYEYYKHYSLFEEFPEWAAASGRQKAWRFLPLGCGTAVHQRRYVGSRRAGGQQQRRLLL
jgi:hypothetical protein